jgi:hypothetical protein
MPDIKVFFDANRATVVDHFENQEFKRLVEKGDYQELLAFYQKLEVAVNKLLKLDSSTNPIIDEISPWLNWSLTEISLVRGLIKGDLPKEELAEKLQDKNRLGVEALDYLVKKQGILTEEEYTELISSRRGNLWWRVWEEKR